MIFRYDTMTSHKNELYVILESDFLVCLFQSSRVHITRAVLEQFLSFAKYLDGLPHGAPLLKQLCDHVLFNAAIWIHTPAKVSFFSVSTSWTGSSCDLAAKKRLDAQNVNQW